MQKVQSLGFSPSRLENIDRLLENAVSSDTIKGAVALIARRGQIVYHKAFGQMDDGVPMRKDSIFRICSMTKPIVAVATMMLWEQGLIELDDPLYKYVPEFKDAKVVIVDKNEPQGFKLEPASKAITIRHLLTHTSGISYGFLGRPVVSQCYLENDISDGFRVTRGTIGEMVKRLARCPLACQPGTKWEYGLNYDVLGHVIEVASGKPLDTFLIESIFKPLRMKDTSFFVPEDRLSRLVALYEPTPEGKLRKVERQVVVKGMGSDVKSMIYDPFYGYKGDRTYLSGGAGLHSTAYDYFRFCQMLLNGGALENVRLLAPHTVKLMVQNHIGELKTLRFPEVQKYGLGFSVEENPLASPAPLPKGTYGWGGIYNTNFFIDPEHEVVAVYMTQLYPNFQAAEITTKFHIMVQAAIVR